MLMSVVLFTVKSNVIMVNAVLLIAVAPSHLQSFLANLKFYIFYFFGQLTRNITIPSQQKSLFLKIYKIPHEITMPSDFKPVVFTQAVMCYILSPLSITEIRK